MLLLRFGYNRLLALDCPGVPSAQSLSQYRATTADMGPFWPRPCTVVSAAASGRLWDFRENPLWCVVANKRTNYRSGLHYSTTNQKNNTNPSWAHKRLLKVSTPGREKKAPKLEITFSNMNRQFALQSPAFISHSLCLYTISFFKTLDSRTWTYI